MQHKLLSMFFSCFCIVALFCFTDLVSTCSASAAKQTSAEAAPSAPHITSDVAAMSFNQRQALKLLNNDRKEKGLAPLQFNPHLSKLAENYAKDMIKRDFFSHVNPEGQSPFERMQEQKIVYNYAGENLAFNESVYAAQQAFMHSPEHKANILNANYTQVGLGIVEASRGRVFVVQEFIDG